jgi:hypothetical protein
LGGLSNIQDEDKPLYDIYIDCLGNQHARNYSTLIKDAANSLIFQVPWNFVGRERTESFAEVLLFLAFFPALKVLFVCAMGEKRSASALGTALCVLHSFHPEAAKAHVENMRRNGEISYEPVTIHGKNIPAAFYEMTKLIPQLEQRLEEKTDDLMNEAATRSAAMSTSSSPWPSPKCASKSSFGSQSQYEQVLMESFEESQGLGWPSVSSNKGRAASSRGSNR